MPHASLTPRRRRALSLIVAATSLAIVLGSVAAPAIAATDEPGAPIESSAPVEPAAPTAPIAPETPVDGVAPVEGWASVSATTISGLVKDRAGKPISDGPFAYLMGMEATSGRWKEIMGSGVAIKNGAYTLTNVEPGAYRLAFRQLSNEYATYGAAFWPTSTTAEAARDVVVTANTPMTGKDIVLAPGAAISGLVDARTSSGMLRPLPRGASIRATIYEKLDGTWQRRADDFTSMVDFPYLPPGYVLSGLPAGTYRVGFSDSSSPYRDQFWPGTDTIETATSITLTAGQTKAATNATMILKSTKPVVLTVNRISGKDRYSTSVELSKFNGRYAQTVYIATGTDYPDALAAAPLLVNRPRPFSSRCPPRFRPL
ncbi:hypothetical protein HNR05_002046 [Leifsonia psychrotolerans]|uniref:Alpha-amylase n=1 Tax=Glaciibacter psychrotolerans TaxID=670054 RepID=A0A7Z0J6C9_9MICO|nr:cell wall-binding repeat-containing protein [Leifsonia psychrotolerans]NYJ20255.1 hypothetical protein [Leifsonia psychrotolerans]